MQHRIALLHPGAMGAALGRCILAAGHRVGWCSAGRGEHTIARARGEEFETYASLEPLLRASDVVLSVCPPAAAASIARAVAAHGYDGRYIDANAIAPATAASVRAVVEDGGARYIDGGVIGPPPLNSGTTWFYLSGSDAAFGTSCFANSPLTVIDLGDDPTAASALKMCFAAWTKGSSALLLAVAATARAAGVEDPLIRQWRESQPDLPATLATSAARDAPKAWRFAGEMDEIAATFRAHGLPAGFHEAAAATFDALAAFRDAASPPEPDAVLQALLDEPGLSSGAPRKINSPRR